MEELVHILAGSACIAALKLQRLTRARQGANRDGAIVGVNPDEVAHKKIASLKLLKVLVHNQSHEQVVARLFLLGF